MRGCGVRMRGSVCAGVRVSMKEMEETLQGDRMSANTSIIANHTISPNMR